MITWTMMAMFCMPCSLDCVFVRVTLCKILCDCHFARLCAHVCVVFNLRRREDLRKISFTIVTKQQISEMSIEQLSGT